MEKITRIEKDFGKIKDGEYFSYVMETIEPCAYYNNEMAYRINGAIYKKVNDKIWNTKVRAIKIKDDTALFGEKAVGYIAEEWHIVDDRIAENLLKENGFAVYTSEKTVKNLDSFCLALKHRSNIL